MKQKQAAQFPVRQIGEKSNSEYLWCYNVDKTNKSYILHGDVHRGVEKYTFYLKKYRVIW